MRASVLCVVTLLILCRGVEGSEVSVPKFVLAIYSPLPKYPRSALARHEEGKGLFVICIEIRTGLVRRVDIARSTGHADLDAVTVAALKKWRFKPNSLASIREILPDRKDPRATLDSLVKTPVTFEIRE